MSCHKRNTQIYHLKQANEIVYIGISNDPERREGEHRRSGKVFNGKDIVSPRLTRSSAEDRETDKIQNYQRDHSGVPPKYNVRKTKRIR